MRASIKDREAWMLEREDEIAERLFGRCFADVFEELKESVRWLARYDYVDAMAGYAESRCGGER